MFAREFAPPGRCAGLIEQGCSLWRRFTEVDRVDAVVFAMMMNLVHLFGMREDPIFTITDYCTILPTSFPKLVNHFHVFVRDVVPQVVGGLRIKSTTACGAVEVPRDDIPASASFGQMI